MPATLRAHFDSRRAYIYVWFSKMHRVAYVGQTNGARGSLGRAAAHVASAGAFRLRFEEEIGLTLERADDLMLVSYPLPKKAKFTGTESSYREGVEYAVQRGLHDARRTLTPRFKLISNVRYSERASLKSVRSYADQIVNHFQTTYRTSSSLLGERFEEQTAG
jgi:hypothetical protein